MASPNNSDLYKPVAQWTTLNRGFYANYRRWLRKGGYSQSALQIYSCAMRLAISQLNKPYWQINEGDLDDVRSLIAARFSSMGTRESYYKGLRKLSEFLNNLQGMPQPEKQVNWSYFLAGLPLWFEDHIRGYVRHRRRAWLPEKLFELSGNILSSLTRFLRWSAGRCGLSTAVDLTPQLWFAYLDERLQTGIKPISLNGELSDLQSFLSYLVELDQPICERMLAVERLKCGPNLPKDVPIDHLRRLYAAIEADCVNEHAGVQRMGIMDRAWFLLMLHSGLRVGEVRRLRQADLDLAGKRVRIEQSKGLKDRIAFLSAAVVAAIEAYLPLRGPLGTDHLFVYRHRPLTATYCSHRMRTYSRRCGVKATAHQLRHSCATLLLNAGTPILTVQTLLGHKHTTTTLGYARLYDGTIAADYYRAMADVEYKLQMVETSEMPLMTSGQLMAMVDALNDGPLNDHQRVLVHSLRQGVLALEKQVNGGHNKVNNLAVLE